MLKKLGKFKTRTPIIRAISESQAKEAHYLFPKETSDPLRTVLYDKALIEEKCQRTRFATSSASFREYQLAREYIKSLEHNAHRIKSFDLPVKLMGLKHLPLPFTEPKLTTYESNIYTENDYKVFYSEEIEKIQTQPLELIKRGKYATYLPSEYQDEITIIKHLMEVESTFNKTNYVTELKENEVLVGNLPNNFEYFAFKMAFLNDKDVKKGLKSVRTIKDMFKQPCLLKLEFDSASEALEFKAKHNDAQFGKSKLKCFTNTASESCEEAYENRTVYVSGFAPSTKEAEILSTVTRFAKPVEIHYPVNLDFNSLCYTSDIMEYIDKNRRSFPADCQIILKEFDGQKSTEILAFEGGVPVESEIKFFTNNDDTLEYVEEYTYDKAWALREKENQELIKKIVRDQSTIYLTTLSDKLRVSQLRTERKEQGKNASTECQLPNDFASLSDDKKAEFIKNLFKRAQTMADKNNQHNKSSVKILTSVNNWPIEATPSGLGWCLVTFATAHEARKAIYGLRFQSHFDKLTVDLHGNKHFFEYFDILNSKIYTTISKRLHDRSEFIERERREAEQAILDANIEQFNANKIKHTRDQNAKPVNLAMGTKFSEYDVQKVREEQNLVRIKAKKDMEQKIRDYMNTFVIEENFSRKENLESRLVGLEKVDDIMQRRGRQMGHMSNDEAMYILKKRLAKTGEEYQTERLKQAGKFISGLKEVIGDNSSFSPKEIANIVDKLALEYGYKPDDISHFRELIEENRRSPVFDKKPYLTTLTDSMKTESQKVLDQTKKVHETKKSNRRAIFERLNQVAAGAKSFSTLEKSYSDVDYLELYNKYYNTLQSKFTGDFYKTREFKEYFIDNFIIKREK